MLGQTEARALRAASTRRQAVFDLISLQVEPHLDTHVTLDQQLCFVSDLLIYIRMLLSLAARSSRFPGIPAELGIDRDFRDEA
ncbi:hypothetical protein EVAR_64038_1 [Eumeta japonica]|uniref:Uncharacterized protein n=1 Tax=Eumeta variegata TaxID=151549 RepID=A0A4C1Z1Q1_EUMVA|nr:hypothetical protein EVAR_64038_1 [Eumeta japonica]